jgi:TRAP-type C4-dicarboxylate transport system permease small subunit
MNFIQWWYHADPIAFFLLGAIVLAGIGLLVIPFLLERIEIRQTDKEQARILVARINNPQLRNVTEQEGTES